MDVHADGGHLSAAQVIELLDLAELPGEGGWFRQTYLDEHSTAIYYLLTPDGFSALHRLTGPEVYHWYAGAPARLVTLPTVPDAGARPRCIDLGGALSEGLVPQAVVPAGVWQGSYTLGAWTLLGTTMAPPYTPDGFELADRETLQAAYGAPATPPGAPTTPPGAPTTPTGAPMSEAAPSRATATGATATGNAPSYAELITPSYAELITRLTRA